MKEETACYVLWRSYKEARTTGRQTAAATALSKFNGKVNEILGLCAALEPPLTAKASKWEGVRTEVARRVLDESFVEYDIVL